MRKNEDPRLSFSTPEFKEAQRVFTDNFKVRSAHAGSVSEQSVGSCDGLRDACQLSCVGKTTVPRSLPCALRGQYLFGHISSGSAEHCLLCSPPPCPAARLLALPQKNFGRPVEYALVKDYAW